MLPGLPSRLEKEVRKLHTKHVLGGKEPEDGALNLNPKLKLRIEDPPRRKHMVTPETLNRNPEPRTPNPETPDPKPQTPNPKPEARSPKPETRNPTEAIERPHKP
jgi:hypothetical protein